MNSRQSVIERKLSWVHVWPWLILLPTCLVLCATRESGAGEGMWERIERVAAYHSERRARYPSIVKPGDGRLLVLFTKQTAEQEQAGRGDLLLTRSNDGGKTWSEAETVYHSQAGEPRAVGTLTRLKSGELLAPVAEWRHSESHNTVRILSSDNNAEHFFSLRFRREKNRNRLQRAEGTVGV